MIGASDAESAETQYFSLPRAGFVQRATSTCAGPWSAGEVKTISDSAGWRFATDGLPSGTVMGASADEDGNIWVAGRNAGVFVQRGGSGRFQQFTLADGLHPYGYLPDGSPAESSPSLAVTPAISISGGPGSSAFVGYQGKEGCEDEWDRYLPDHRLLAVR